jgi:dUTP pyrophosphatase
MKFTKVRNVKSPVRGTSKSAGIDFFVPTDLPFAIRVQPHSDFLIPSGIKMNIPEGFMLMAADKSGVVTSTTSIKRVGMVPKEGAFDSVIIIGAKIVDEDYQGEIGIHVINCSDTEVIIEPNTKIAQFILVPVSYEELEEVDEKNLFNEVSERGNRGFGHGTGTK